MLAELLAKNNCMIEELVLNQTDLDNESLTNIMNSFLVAVNLKKMSLSMNLLDVMACKHLSVIMQTQNRFQVISLSHCEIGNNGIKQLSDGLCSLD